MAGPVAAPGAAAGQTAAAARQLAKAVVGAGRRSAAARRLRPDALWVPYWAALLWQPCPVAVTVHDLIPLLLPAYRGGFLQRRTALVAASAPSRRSPDR